MYLSCPKNSVQCFTGSLVDPVGDEALSMHNRYMQSYLMNSHNTGLLCLLLSRAFLSQSLGNMEQRWLVVIFLAMALMDGTAGVYRRKKMIRRRKQTNKKMELKEKGANLSLDFSSVHFVPFCNICF